MVLPSTLVLLTLAWTDPTVSKIDDARFRVSIVYDDKSPRGHANAQLSLMRFATTYCKGKGKAVSEGTLELNKAEPIRRGKEALSLSEVYSCKPTE